MPTVLITTSRNTSNRVRSFVRDLHSVLPRSERFNRGGMNIKELVARISQSDAKAALVITMFKGNPRTIQILLPTGSIGATLFLESAILRREIIPDKGPRISGAISVCIEENTSQQARILADSLSELLDVMVSERTFPMCIGEKGRGQIELWLSSLPNGKILWTHYHALDAKEIGPRMRITKYERS
ncbi:MAG: hypothetical protein EAX81_02170 [Candidatus Thorarchaeota archaeon]|nr:hypothetical protein [Candidatus Thorarchaeota archaeon]